MTLAMVGDGIREKRTARFRFDDMALYKKAQQVEVPSTSLLALKRQVAFRKLSESEIFQPLGSHEEVIVLLETFERYAASSPKTSLGAEQFLKLAHLGGNFSGLKPTSSTITCNVHASEAN